MLAELTLLSSPTSFNLKTFMLHINEHSAVSCPWSVPKNRAYAQYSGFGPPHLAQARDKASEIAVPYGAQYEDRTYVLHEDTARGNGAGEGTMAMKRR